LKQGFFKEKVRYPVCTCRDPISLILGTRFEILETQFGSLKHLKKTLVEESSYVQQNFETQHHCTDISTSVLSLLAVSALDLFQLFNFSPVSVACRCKDWWCV